MFNLLLEASEAPLLSALNECLLTAIARKLGIATPIRRCTGLLERGAMEAMDPTARLLALCKVAGASNYLSGPNARGYLDESRFMEPASGSSGWITRATLNTAALGAVRARGLDRGSASQRWGPRSVVLDPARRKPLLKPERVDSRA